ncbi:MAG: cobaltochelatase subunit CobN [Emcibacter sp.]|nr:cobaltochelatase subunit CobN [Emcibacter sp.]
MAYLQGQTFGTGTDNILPPIVFPEAGIYHPAYDRLIFANLQDYLTWRGHKEGQPVIGLTLSREAIAAADTGIEDHFIREIEQRGGLAVPYYFPGFLTGQMAGILSVDGKVAVDNIINMSPIHMAEARRADYEEMGVPILQTIPYSSGTQQDWEKDPAGIPPMQTPFFLTLSEIAGTMDPVVVSAFGKDQQRVPIGYQMGMVIEKAFRLASLKHKANGDKKVAIMFYNYPPGEKNAGASFLNIPRSLESIAGLLKEQGYQVNVQNEDWYIDQVGKMLRPFFRGLPYTDIPGLGDEAGAGGLLAVQEYRKWYDQLPAALRGTIEAEWGSPEEAFSIVEVKGQKYFAIPRVLSGNLIILPQPPRGNRKDQEKSIYHDKTVPISHNYLAAYFYVRETFGADALIHLGTHGTQEYLPGKERGLSRYDAGNLALGDIPVIYPFIMDDVGEALQTKRRGRATVISHLTPPLVKSGLYQEISDLHNLMHEYNALGEGAVKSNTKKQIIDLVIERNIHQDVAWTEEKIITDFEDFMAVLHDYIGELGTEIQPLGLHTFDELPEKDHLTSTIVQMLGRKFAEPAIEGAGKYLPELPIDKTGAAPKEAEYVDFTQLKNSAEFRMVDKYVLNNANLDVVKDKNLRELLQKAREYHEGFTGILEGKSMINALNGMYIPSSTGGDPVRSPVALPSGKNLYGFDPSKLPTKAAWESGKQLTADLIQNFHTKNGRFPDKITFSLWSIEAMRHLGVIESQVMYAMGVRPVWDENGYVKDTAIIPYGELGRPRIDVVMSATGLYRDALPNVMLLLAKAVEKVAKLKEDNNYIFQNTARLKAELLDNDFSTEDANILSTVRIFSNENGTYGTGLGEAALASDTWEKDDKLARLYISRMGYAYGSDTGLWGKKYENINLYARNLTGTDAAVFSRSSNVYGLLTSDDPFQYMGGISLAVRMLDGKSPEMFISNLRDPDNLKSETLGKFLSKELRTRYFHPQYLY